MQRKYKEAQDKKNELKPKRDLYIGIVCVAFAAFCCWPLMIDGNKSSVRQQHYNKPTAEPQSNDSVKKPPYTINITGVTSSDVNGQSKPKKGNIFLSVHYTVTKNMAGELDDPMVRSVLKTKNKEWPNRNQTGAASYVPRMASSDPSMTSWITFEVPKKEIKEPFKVVLDGHETEISPSAIQE